MNIPVVVALSLFLSASGLPPSSPGTVAHRDPCVGDLHVVTTNLRSDRGIVRVFLANSAESYAFGGQPFRTADIQPEGRSAIVTFRSIPCGDYAIRLFHDENTNGRLDANFARVPIERYGFSNNVRKRFGPADYSMARFQLTEPRLELEIVAR